MCVVVRNGGCVLLSGTADVCCRQELRMCSVVRNGGYVVLLSGTADV
jgi:hypothetical protein